jgi:hypothetical protein
MITALEALLDNILADPLAGMSADEGAIGYVGLDIPLEILLASERRYAHLPWQKGRKTPDADKWLESSFPGWARSMLQDWMAGRFDVFDTVIFSRGDDAVQRLYYYLCELQRRGVVSGPRPVMYDVARIPRPSSVLHTRQAIRHLAQMLDIDEAALAPAIDAANIRRSLYGMLDVSRTASGRLLENIARASLFRDLADELSGLAFPASEHGRRLLLAGSVPPDDSFHVAAEAAGWNVVGESHQRTPGRFGPPIEVGDADPVMAMAEQYNSCPLGPRAFSDRASRLATDMKRCQADAVVLWLTEDDEALAWHVTGQRRVLADSHLPHLVMTRRRWDGADDSVAEMRDFLMDHNI